MTNLKELIIDQKHTLNLEVAQKRLILLAFIRSNFKERIAFRLNCEDNPHFTLDGYRKLWRSHFPEGIKVLKENFKKTFDFEENLDGRLIKIKLKKNEKSRDSLR